MAWTEVARLLALHLPPERRGACRLRISRPVSIRSDDSMPPKKVAQKKAIEKAAAPKRAARKQAKCAAGGNASPCLR